MSTLLKVNLASRAILAILALAYLRICTISNPTLAAGTVESRCNLLMYLIDSPLSLYYSLTCFGNVTLEIATQYQAINIIV